MMFVRSNQRRRFCAAKALELFGLRKCSISSRVQRIGKNVFAEISQLAAKHNAVNLGQGFPSFQTPECVING